VTAARRSNAGGGREPAILADHDSLRPDIQISNAISDQFVGQSKRPISPLGEARFCLSVRAVGRAWNGARRETRIFPHVAETAGAAQAGTPRRVCRRTCVCVYIERLLASFPNAIMQRSFLLTPWWARASRPATRRRWRWRTPRT